MTKMIKAGMENPKRAQAMLMSIVSISMVFVGATIIAGVLQVFQIRQSSDFANSTKAIYAADAGLEWGLYQMIKRSGLPVDPAPILSNGATIDAVCRDVAGTVLDCTDAAVSSISATGKSARSSRALQASF